MTTTVTPRSATPWVAGLAALALVPLLTLAACGGGSDSTAKSGDHSGHSSMPGMTDEEMANMGGGSSADAGATTGTSPMGDMMSLGDATTGGVKITLAAMSPETFYVPEGDQQVKHAPTKDDTVHLMAAIADAESGVRLPDATVTVSIKGSSGSVFDGPLYPMIGRGMGLHYGENIALSAPGKYTVRVVASPPKVGRHTDVEHAWSKTVTASFPLTWDGKMAMRG